MQNHIKGKKNVFIGVFFIISIFSINSNAIANRSEINASTDRIDPVIIHGIALIYSWEFSRAEEIFQDIIKERPKDPVGYFYLAMVTWSRLAAGFWSPPVIDQYLQRIEQTVSVAKDKIEHGEADSFTYFFLGGALGFKARFQLMEHKWFSAYFVAVEAIDALKTCLTMDPDNKDVLFGLGMYDYYTAQLSGVLRFLSYIFFHRGKKEEGLRKLRLAATEAPYSSIEAKSLLVHIYLFLEPDVRPARKIIEELAERFPGNPRFQFLSGVAYIRLDLDTEYQNVRDYLRSMAQKDGSIASPIWGNRALYLEATDHLFHDRFQEARSLLEAIALRADPILDPSMAVWPLLKIGMSYDLEGRRQRAIEYYNHVFGLENGAGAQFLAEKYLKEPVAKDDPFLGY
jgi:tetratricopeptide (TPR) repeat protein